MFLKEFENSKFERGVPRYKELLWLIVSGIFIESWIPGSIWRVVLLRFFGAKIGTGVIIKPRVKIKFPWRITIKDNSWIGECVWIDSLSKVYIGSNVCISQGTYLCTGSHDWSKRAFDLIVLPIVIHDHVWICARCIITPGTIVEEGAVIKIGQTASGRIVGWSVHSNETSSKRLLNLIK